MKTKLASYSRAETTDRDTIIGRALCSALANSAPAEKCPSAEQLTVLVDGNATEEEQDSLFGHMAVCDRCREIYLLAHDLSLEEPVQRSYRGWYLGGGALAAVALVALAVKLTIQEPAVPEQKVAKAPVRQQVAQALKATPNQPVTTAQQEQPKHSAFSATMAARQLAKAASADSLAAVIGAPAPGSYGFAGSGSPQAAAFRAGRELLEMELWLASGDKERAGLAAERLIPLLRSVESDDATTARLDGLLRHLETVKIDDVTRQLEALLKPHHRGIIRLGSWVAAARLGVETGKDPYFAGNPPQHFLKELGTSLSSDVRDILGKLDKKKVGNDPAEIRRLLDMLSAAI
jgi:hypothetical protein